MQSIHMKFQPKPASEKTHHDSSHTRLSKTNVFSATPRPADTTAIAYSKGRLENMPEVNWDQED